MRIAQRDASQTQPHGLEDDRSFTIGEDHMGHANRLFAGHGVADDCECFLPDQVAWGDVVRRVVISRIDLRSRYEAFDVDGPCVLDARTRLRNQCRRLLSALHVLAFWGAAPRWRLLHFWLGLGGRWGSERSRARLCAPLRAP